MSEKDQIFAEQQDQITDFKFDQKVARVFPDMIKRSVPGYSSIVAMIGVMAKDFAQIDSHLYDLGCSLGAVTLSMRNRVSTPGCRIIAVDNSLDMLKRAEQHIDQEDSVIPVKLVNADIADIKIENASVVVMNFTLQFIEKSKRDLIIKNIFDGLKSGGILILSEKIRFESSEQQELLETLQLDFKRFNGYSELEISQKRAALENVMTPETENENHNRLKQAGFEKVYTWFQCFNFFSMVAIKS